MLILLVRTGVSGGQHSVKPTNWEIFWAGCAGGAAQLVVACPVDLAKIKLQVQTQAGQEKAIFTVFALATNT